jgi:hypothetical protein
MALAYKKDEEVFLKGKIKWCKHIRPDATYNKWSVTMYIAGAELDKAREWQAMGIKNTIKKDDDGWYITLSRKTSITVKNREIGLEPPHVVDKEGKPITEMVGNGSDGVAKCILWSTRNYPGKNLRWEALRVDNFIPFTPANDYPDGGESLENLKKEPELLF